MTPEGEARCPSYNAKDLIKQSDSRKARGEQGPGSIVAESGARGNSPKTNAADDKMDMAYRKGVTTKTKQMETTSQKKGNEVWKPAAIIVTDNERPGDLVNQPMEGRELSKKDGRGTDTEELQTVKQLPRKARDGDYHQWKYSPSELRINSVIHRTSIS